MSGGVASNHQHDLVIVTIGAGKMRDEYLDRERFEPLPQAQVLVEVGRHVSNHVRPHSPLGYQLPAPEARIASSLPR